jgi:DNA helicase-2/ATP-dependent DNA helicase PcrA
VKRLKLNIQPNTARSRISSQKAQGISWEELAEKHHKGVDQQEFVQVYREYESALANSNLLDYDDLLLRCVDLLRQHPHCVSNVQAVLVDEFQDTNRIQFDLMNLFAARHRRITIVGDPDQSIYGFRSAEIKNLERMQRLYRDTAVVLLEDNYRSSGAILSSAEEVIEQDTSRPTKKLQPTHVMGTMPVLRKLPTAAAEAQWLVTEIKRCIGLTGNLLKHSDIAVLLRSASLSRQIESEMGKQGIPYRMVGGSRFFDRVEIRLLLDYLRVVSHPENTDALIRIINVPSRRIGDETVRILTAGAEEANIPMWAFIKDVAQGRRSTKKSVSKATDQGMCAFVGLIESARQKLRECFDDSSPRILLEFVIKKLSFREYLTATYPLDEENRWANVEELLAQAGDTSNPAGAEQNDSLPDIDGLEQRQEHQGEEALSRFLANVVLSTEISTEEGDQPQEKVTISTIHAAKGLEWPVVFVPAVYEGIIPHSRAEDSDEERRLLYVAMTRAQALLYLSFPLRDSKNGDETTQTSFLPMRIVESRFRPTGPKFQDKSVFGIADILRRTRPADEDMLRGIDGLPSVYDDLWTADGEQTPGTVTRWDGSQAVQPVDDQLPWPKRRRLDHADGGIGASSAYVASSSYTMSNAATFSVSNSTVSLGFSTARQHLVTAQAKGDADPGKSKPTTETGAGRRTGGLTQGTISNFFGQPGEKPGARSLPSSSTMQPARTGRNEQIGCPVNASQESRGCLSRQAQQLPSDLTVRRVQPQRFQPPRPILEVSDPNRYTWLSGSKGPCHLTKSDDVSTKQEIAAATVASGEIKKPSSLAGGARPAATYHTTTMAMVQQIGSNSGRKTLGIRRSMQNGWAERMSRASNHSGDKT